MFPCKRNRPKVSSCWSERQPTADRAHRSEENPFVTKWRWRPRRSEACWVSELSLTELLKQNDLRRPRSHYLKHELTEIQNIYPRLCRHFGPSLPPRPPPLLLLTSSSSSSSSPCSSSASSSGRQRKGGMWRGGRRREVPPSLCSCSKLSSAGGYYGLREPRGLKANIDSFIKHFIHVIYYRYIDNMEEIILTTILMTTTTIILINNGLMDSSCCRWRCSQIQTLHPPVFLYHIHTHTQLMAKGQIINVGGGAGSAGGHGKVARWPLTLLVFRWVTWWRCRWEGSGLRSEAETQIISHTHTPGELPECTSDKGRALYPSPCSVAANVS